MVIDNKTMLFVFYTMNEDKWRSWSYNNDFPKGWYWVGSGSTSAIGEYKKEYEREEQFDGLVNNQKIMRKYLKIFFTDLKERGIIKIFKIRNSYKP